MKRVVMSSKLWVAFVLWASFWVFVQFLPNDLLFYLVNALAMCVAAGVLIAYYPGIKDALIRRDVGGGHWLILGIAVTWGATMIRIGYAWLWRLLGQPEWMSQSPILAFITWMIVTGGMLHLIAQNAINGQIPKGNWLRLGLWTTAGLFTGFLISILFGDGVSHVVRP